MQIVMEETKVLCRCEWLSVKKIWKNQHKMELMCLEDGFKIKGLYTKIINHLYIDNEEVEFEIKSTIQFTLETPKLNT